MKNIGKIYMLNNQESQKDISVELFVTSEGEGISDLIAFIKRNIKDIPVPRLKKLIGGEGDKRFYLVEMEVLGGSLLQHLVEHKHLVTQRDELLDLLVKIEGFDLQGNRLQDTEK